MVQVKHIIGATGNFQDGVNKALKTFAEKKYSIRDVQYSINNMTPFTTERFTAIIVFETTDLNPQQDENKSI